MHAVNSDTDLLSRHAAQIASCFHHTTKILLTASPVWMPWYVNAIASLPVGEKVSAPTRFPFASKRAKLCALISFGAGVWV